jgi:hypothetical protein
MPLAAPGAVGQQLTGGPGRFHPAQGNAGGGQGIADAGIPHPAHQPLTVGVSDHAISAAGAHQLQQFLGGFAVANQQTAAALA